MVQDSPQGNQMNIYCDSNKTRACIVVEGRTCPMIIDYNETVTNNVGEYRAVWFALDLALKFREQGRTDIVVMTDSQLVVGQVVGIDGKVWKCNHAHLLPLRDSVRDLLKDTDIKLGWIPREENLAGLVLGD